VTEGVPSGAEARDPEGLDNGCGGMEDGVGVGVLDSAAGFGLTRLREPMAQIEQPRRCQASGGLRCRCSRVEVASQDVVVVVVVVLVGVVAWLRAVR
jgi:hypothetical protein